MINEVAIVVAYAVGFLMGVGLAIVGIKAMEPRYPETKSSQGEIERIVRKI